jgi:alpha-mannosidase
MHDNQDKTEARVRHALESRLKPRAWAAEPEPCEVAVFPSGSPVTVEEALAASYQPAGPGLAWGAPWSTTWFRLSGKVPAEWAGARVEAVIDLGFNDRNPGFQAEGMAFDAHGVPIKGLAPRNNWVAVDTGAKAGGTWTCFVEAVAMPSIMGGGDDRFHPTPLGDVATAGTAPLYVLGGADLVLVDETARALAADVEVLVGVMGQLERRDARRHEILRALERCLDRYDLDGDAEAGRQALAGVLAAPAARTAHTVSAVGHAHIDSAWLWPVRETVRKCARTFANMAALAEDYPELVFACSQAQQWWWMKQRYPVIFQRMKDLVAKGRIVPTGSMWVEPDTNVTGGESLVRQLVFGKRFFMEELGVETEDVWLPDCFGYSAAFPQLVRLAGARWFLTQKLSWNDTNKFPHHSFWWEGIDGTRVFTHFPPVDTYNAQLLPSELAHAARNYAETGYASRSLAPFGYGDGGGGPTREMMERARRLANLDGSPKVVMEAPGRFFQAALDEYPDAPVWSGELYLELHRGTLTNQVEIKQGNRRCENLLREAELWSTAAMVAGAAPYPYDELEEIWRDILLNQFHDILPGSSIAMVNNEAIAGYARNTERLHALVEKALSALAGPGQRRLSFNPAPHARDGVAAFASAPTPGPGSDARSADARSIENEHLRVVVNDDGHITSLFDLGRQREVVPPGAVANVLQLHPDIPNKWPAWDIDPFYRHSKRDLAAPTSIEVTGSGPGEAALRLEYAFGPSKAVQTLRLAAGSRVLDVEIELDWHEQEKLLKVDIPVDVHADRSTSEIQFGHLQRATHTNTSWEEARFEFVAHRYLHVGEPGYGVAVVNDGIYGHEARAVARAGGGRSTVVRLSLVRSANFPDPRGENGPHRFHYAIAPGAGLEDAVREGYRLNSPAREVTGGRAVSALVSCSDGVVVETVKAADDRSGDVVVRCYEPLGNRATAQLATSFAVASASITDLLERPTAGLEVTDGHPAQLELRPFEVVTVRLTPAR